MVKKMPNNHKITIRKAIEADLPVLVSFLAKLALHVAGAPAQDLKKNEHNRLMGVLRSALTDKSKLLAVAETQDAKLVGMGYVYVWHNQGIWEQTEEVEFKSGIIDDVWVEPEFRSLGIFRTLLRELVTFAEHSGAHELILEYSASNKEAQAAWTKLGFTTTGVRAAAFTATVKQALADQQ